MSLWTTKTLLSTRKLSSKVGKKTHGIRRPFDTIPGPKPLPLIGNIWRYLPLIGEYKIDTLFENAQYNKRRYGPIVREKITEKHTILHLFDPNDIETFFRQDGRFPYRRSHRALLKYRLERPHQYNDGGLFPENGPAWYRQRNQFQQRLMSKSQVLAHVPKMDQVSLAFIRTIDASFQGCNRENSIDDFETLLYKWALANSLSLFIDCDIEQLEESVVEKLVQQLHNSLTATEKTEIQTEKWISHPDKCPHYKMLVQSQDLLRDFVEQQVMKSELAPMEVSYLNDWLHKDKIERHDVISFIMDTLMAGFHTTSYTIAFMLYHIAQHESIQNDLHSEVTNNIDRNKLITTNQLEKLPLLRDCLKESMRLNPVSIGTGRLTTQDDLTINNYKVPKDTQLITQNQAISRDEKIYSEPENFMPQRWATYRTCPRSSKPSPFASLPFGFGARSCIGQRLAELQIKIMTARLLQNYHITSCGEIKTKTALIHTIDGHFGIKLRKL